MRFEDEPVPGYPLPILPGHTSPGPSGARAARRRFRGHCRTRAARFGGSRRGLSRARVFDGYVDAINATDGSGANCHMSSLAVCALLTTVGYAPVMQISCRDKNRIAIQGDILGGAAMGVCNVLCLTGDGVQAGDHPQAKPVFDLDSTSLLGIARGLRDDHRFESGRKISYAPRVLLGAAENPNVSPVEHRAVRLAKKIAAGAQFVQTQYCYDMPLLRRFMTAVEDAGLLDKVFILIGVGPLRTAKAGEVDAHARARHSHSRFRHRAHERRQRPDPRGPEPLRRPHRGDPHDQGREWRACHGVPSGRVRGGNYPAIGCTRGARALVPGQRSAD